MYVNAIVHRHLQCPHSHRNLPLHCQSNPRLQVSTPRKTRECKERGAEEGTVIVFIEIFVCVGVCAWLLQFIVLVIPYDICSIGTFRFVFCGFRDIFFIGDFQEVIEVVFLGMSF
jgi:hypothetical protein